jgi:hypothetical protein
MADYFFLFRDKSITNRVAFPNKFLEYVLAGGKIISTSFCGDVSKYILKNDFGFFCDDIESFDFNSFKPEKLVLDSKNFQCRKLFVEDLNFSNTLLPIFSNYG